MRSIGRVGNSAATTKRARELRQSLTRQEARLWLQLRALRQEGFHFRRQAPLLGFFLDFVCFRHRLVVEVDGSQHGEETRADHDAMRDNILRRAGFRTLRFWNTDVDANLDGVVATIQQALGMPPAPLQRSGANLRAQRTASDIPTLAASRPVPPHEGEGGE
jgi:very-short-patch-repair endonuclease